MTDSATQLSSLTGIPRPELLKIWDDVKLNSAKLEACARHDFLPVYPGQFGTKFVCSRCAGLIDGMSARWYADGLAHAAATPTPGVK